MISPDDWSGDRFQTCRSVLFVETESRQGVPLPSCQSGRMFVTRCDRAHPQTGRFSRRPLSPVTDSVVSYVSQVFRAKVWPSPQSTVGFNCDVFSESRLLWWFLFLLLMCSDLLSSLNPIIPQCWIWFQQALYLNFMTVLHL